MEIYIKRIRQFAITVLAIGITYCMFSCSSCELEESSTLNLMDASAFARNDDGTESLTLNTGQTIILEDTVTYVLDFSKDVSENLSIENVPNITRAVYYTGFDREILEKKNRKYILKGFEKFGLDPNTTYVGKFNTYYKDLPARNGYSILPSNKKYDSETTPCIGFNPPSHVNVGFHIDASSSTTETAVTTSFFVVSDQAGIAWNRDVPCKPDEYIWYFQYIADE